MSRTTTYTRSFVRDDGATGTNVRFEFTPGTAESGTRGPPEDYDPGCGPEIYVLSAKVDSDGDGSAVTLTAAEERRFAIETLQDPEFDPDPDPRH